MIRRRWCVPTNLTEELVHNLISQFTFNVLSAAAGACFSSKKISQPSDFGYLFCGQHGRNKLRLRSSMYLVEMTLAGRLR